MVTISDARITFVYGECFTGHLEIESDEYPVLWSEWDYDWAYNKIRGDLLPGFAFPWRDSQKSAFWRHYLGDTPGSVPAERAWEKFVPLRLLLQTEVIGTELGERVLVDVFGFPYGLVVAVTVHVAKGAAMPMDVWVDRLRAIRFGPAFLERTAPRTLEALCGSLLDQHREAFYLGAAAGTRSAEPMSINTVLQAMDGEPDQPVSEEVRRQLHAVTAWPAEWRIAVLPPVGPPTFLPIRTRNQVAGDVHYAATRGRTVWRPGLFAKRTARDGPQRRHSLSCLAHNLVAGTVQAEMLRLFADRLAAIPRMRDDLDMGTMRNLSRIVDGLRRGNNTFRSSSIQHQLEDPSSRAAVNALLSLADAPLIS